MEKLDKAQEAYLAEKKYKIVLTLLTKLQRNDK